MRAFLAWGALALGLVAAAAAQDASVARVTYNRTFKGSKPEFVQVVIGQDGKSEFVDRETDQDAPVRLSFTASTAVVQQVFNSAHQLHDFAASKLEAKTTVAYMGTKTLAYDDEARHAEQEFNYTENPQAEALHTLFEKIATCGQDALELQQTMQYDHLGVPAVLDQIGDDWKAERLAEPQLLIPVLQKLASNAAMMNSSRSRATKQITAMSGKPKSDSH